MSIVKNPILAGMHPDPSILRVKNDYYLAVSSFEWFPGVEIYHSKDLVNWELVARPLNRSSQLNMVGVDFSCGVWAPCLSYCDGLFYLVYSNVKYSSKDFRDTPNYLVTASDVRGDWSEPVYLNSSGFDASLFHDKNGKKWLVNMINDSRPWKGTNGFGGILIQEYSPQKKQLIGEKEIIFRGSGLGTTEGPHLYYYNGFYYLMVAEGGTGYDHAVVLARSQNLFGPYEISPYHPLLTSVGYPLLKLQKAGHASLVDTPQGRWYIAHLCGRPVGSERKCILGRETALQEVEWTIDGWLKMKNGKNFPEEEIEVSSNEIQLRNRTILYDFEDDQIPFELRTLREPLRKKEYSLTERKGYLRLYGGESLGSCFHQNMVAFRQENLEFISLTKLEFSPKHFQQMAGMAHYYNTIDYLYLFITKDEDRGRILNIHKNQLGDQSYPIGAGIVLPFEGAVWLKMEVHNEKSFLSYSLDGSSFVEVFKDDISYLSDDAHAQVGRGCFTGPHICLCCQDLAGDRGFADFDLFRYEGLEV